MTPDGNDRWNYTVLLVQGTGFDAARVLASPRLVLPFLYIALGAPVFLAGVLLPLVQFSRLVSQIAAAPVVRSARTRNWYLLLCYVAIAGALAVVALATEEATPTLVVVVFLSVSLVLGMMRGLNTLAYNDLLGRTLAPESRNTLLYAQSAIAGAVAIGATWFAHHLSTGATPIRHHLNLLWAGVTVTVIAAVLVTLIREPTAVAKAAVERRSYFSELREGLRRAVEVAWFRQYIVSRCLLVTVELAMPFYAIHSAVMHSEAAGTLGGFVVATSVAVILGGPLWRCLGHAAQPYIMALGAWLTGLAGVWALIIHVTPPLQHPLAHSIVFGLVALGYQGVSGARTLYLVNTAPDADRAYFTAVANTLSGALGVALALAFGAMAHIQGVEWPVLLVVLLNVLAGFYCLRLTAHSSPLSSLG